MQTSSAITARKSSIDRRRETGVLLRRDSVHAELKRVAIDDESYSSVDDRLQCAACAGCAERRTFRPRTSFSAGYSEEKMVSSRIAVIPFLYGNSFILSFSRAPL